MTFDVYARQAFAGRNTSTLSLCSRMAWNQSCAYKRWNLEERYPQARTHFHYFAEAKARLTQRAEFVRGGDTWSFVPKVDAGFEPAQQKPKLTRESHQPKKVQKQKPQQDQWGRRRPLLPQILGPFSSGAPSKRRIGWNCNACSTESTSSSQTRVKMGQRQHDASQQTTSNACRPGSTPVHAKWILQAADAAQKLQRASYRRVT